MPLAPPAVAVGLAAGVLSGAFGVGGGVVTAAAIMPFGKLLDLK